MEQREHCEMMELIFACLVVHRSFTRSRTRSRRADAIWRRLVIEALRTPRSIPDMYVQCRPAASASCSCVSPALSLNRLIFSPRGLRGSVTLVTTPDVLFFALWST